MKSEMIKNEMRSVEARTQGLRMPMRMAPVERTLAATAAMSSQGGVGPSFGWSDIGQIAQVAGPLLASLL
jgi:hypothetical protein